MAKKTTPTLFDPPTPTVESRIDEARALLKKHWGHDDFRPAQTDLLRAIFDGRDALGILPTGGGKSVIFQIPPLVTGGTCLVISPLIALMKDQIDDCNRRGIPASCINSHVDPSEQRRRFDGLLSGKYRVMYIAPERINNAEFRQLLPYANVSLLATDESHCASMFGHDFRPAYQRIREIVALLPKRPPVLALTATATPEIEADIIRALGMRADHFRVVGDPVRPNLSYEVYQGSVEIALRRIIESYDLKDGRHLIYSVTRKLAEALKPKVVAWVAENLHTSGDHNPNDSAARMVGLYHGGMEGPARTAMQDRFKGGDLKIVIATSAFGMGIDIPNIRTVTLAGITASLEDATQQLGRAGRDGLPARAIVIHDLSTIRGIEFLLDINNPPYDAFIEVWAYLQERLPDTVSILRRTGDEIAADIKNETGQYRSGGQILTVLAVMEKFGLVDCASGGATLEVRFEPPTLSSHLQDKNPRVPSTIVGHTLLQHGVGNILTKSREEIMRLSGLTEEQMDSGLDRLEQDGVVERSPKFLGKTTRFIDRDADLARRIPFATIEAKRKRDFQRLSDMKSYTQSKDRIKFIRDYFGVADPQSPA